MRRSVFTAIGCVLSVLAFANVFFTANFDDFVANFASLGLDGQIVVVAVICGFCAASFGIVLLMARRQSVGGSGGNLIFARDLVFVVSAVSFGSFLMLLLFAIMRGDSAGVGPTVNGATVLVIFLLSLFAWAVLSLLVRMRSVR